MNNGTKSWHNWLESAKDFAKKGRGFLFERVQCLAKVMEDSEFKDEAIHIGKGADEILADLTSDTCTNATVLVQTLKKFPTKVEWETGNLGQMTRETIASFVSAKTNGKKQREDEKEAKDKGEDERVHSWKKEFLELERKYELLREENKLLRQQIKDLKDVVKGFQNQRKKQTAGV